MQEERKGVPAKLHYLFDWKKFNKMVTTYVENEEQIESSRKVRDPTLLYQMMQAFVAKYEAETDIEYEVQEGRDFGPLKSLRDYFIERIKKRKIKDGADPQLAEATEQDVLDSWQMFLDNLPSFWIKKALTPRALWSNINPIMNDIANEYKRINQTEGQTTGAASFTDTETTFTVTK